MKPVVEGRSIPASPLPAGLPEGRGPTLRYRLYPNRAQDKALDFLLWQGRNLYNAALEQKIKTYQETGKVISYPEQWAHFRDERNANPETLGKLNATSVQPFSDGTTIPSPVPECP